MVHNLVVGGAPRMPLCLGLPIKLTSIETQDDKDCQVEASATFAENRVMWTLMGLEEKFEGYGRALLPEPFPGKLIAWELE